MSTHPYVLVTAARNEEAYIEKTLDSVVAQTAKPRKWVIANDGSTDATAAIVLSYAQRHDFIELLNIQSDHERNFTAQVQAIRLAVKQLEKCEYDFLGNLDADIAFDANYYQTVLERFDQNPLLGLAGGFVYEPRRGAFTYHGFNSTRSVPHAVQLFRRQCYEEIGGYLALPYGGSDWLAEIMARMRGWEVRGFPDLPVCHFRKTAAEGGILKGRFRQGRMDYSIGSMVLFEIVKCARRVFESPFLIGALCRFAGYGRALLDREPQPLPDDVLQFLRQEQIRRLVPWMTADRPSVVGGTRSQKYKPAHSARNQ